MGLVPAVGRAFFCRISQCVTIVCDFAAVTDSDHEEHLLTHTASEITIAQVDECVLSVICQWAEWSILEVDINPTSKHAKCSRQILSADRHTGRVLRVSQIETFFRSGR